MAKRLSLSKTGDLRISGEFLVDENKLFSLNTFGDLITNKTIIVAEPNIERPNLILSIGEDGSIVYGTLGKLIPEDAKPNLINPSSGYGYAADSVVQNTDHYLVAAYYNGAGLVFPVNLEPGKSYRIVVDVEILETDGKGIRIDAYNVTKGKSAAYSVSESASNIGVVYKLIGTFTAPEDTLKTDLIEVEVILADGADGLVRYKVYKDSLSLVEI